MKILNTMLIFAVAFLAVFGEAALPGLRHLFGAQVDLLPVLMVYAALNASLTAVTSLAILGGLWFDALSANPLGVSILPLFAVGFVVFLQRDLILRELSFAQIVLGTVASAVVPVLTVLLLLRAHRVVLVRIGGLEVSESDFAFDSIDLLLSFVYLLFQWIDRCVGHRFLHSRMLSSSFDD